MATLLYRLFTSRVLALWALQGIRPEGEVLEIGAGVAAMAAHLLETTPRLQMVVTDYDPAMVTIAERSLGRFSERAAVACVDACDLPFDDGRFDFVLALAMLHHTGDWRRAVGEAIRVLRPSWSPRRLRPAGGCPDAWPTAARDHDPTRATRGGPARAAGRRCPHKARLREQQCPLPRNEEFRFVYHAKGAQR